MLFSLFKAYIYFFIVFSIIVIIYAITGKSNINEKDEVIVKTQINDPYKNLSEEDKIRLKKIVEEYKD